MKTFRELIVWQKSIELTKAIYVITKKLPREEMFGLSSQLQRAAVSIPSNIAEGSKRHGSKEFVQFCAIAKGSAAEIETQLILCEQIYKVDIQHVMEQLNEVQKMLEGLCKSLKTTN